MDLSKVRGGELIAAVGGIVLLIALLFLDWYSASLGVTVETPIAELSVTGDFKAWDNQGFVGTLANLIILAAGIVAVGLAVLTAASRTVALPVAASALTAGLGIAAVVMVVGRILFQPGPNGLVDLKYGIFVALIGAIAVAYGGWQSMQEEGTTFGEARDRLQRPSGRETPPAAAPPPMHEGPGEPSSSTPPPSRPSDDPDDGGFGA